MHKSDRRALFKENLQSMHLYRSETRLKTAQERERERVEATKGDVYI